MRVNNHILTRNNYQEMSSYKIRQPLDNKMYENRSNQYQNYISQENKIKTSNNVNRQTALNGYYINQSRKPVTSYQDRSQNLSRDLSYQSKGSNISKNSIKMTDYVALQAKNLLNNKDKFKFQGQQNHARSSSMQYYPKSSMKFNTKNHYTIQKNQQQPYEIPSFGIQCRSTISSYDKPSTFIQHNSSTSYYKESIPSQTYQLRNQKIKTEIDERIQRLRTASNSSQHKQRLNTIKVLDANRIQNMDKINIKIKNILKTLQNEQDLYKRKFTDPFNLSDRIKTIESTTENKYDKYDGMKYSQSRIAVPKQQRAYESKQYNLSQVKNYPYQRQPQQRSSFNQLNNISTKYDNNTNNRFTNQYHQYQQQDSFHNQTYDECKDINVSSYYCYDDNQEAYMKSSQSPIKTSSDKSFKKFSVSKWESKQQKSPSKRNQIKNSSAGGQQKLKYSQNTQKLSHKKQSQQRQNQQKYESFSMLNNIPQCQTQLIESKTTQNFNHYHTFQQKSRQYDEKTSQIYKGDYQFSKKNINNDKVDSFNHHKKNNEVYMKIKNQQQKFKNTNYEHQKSFKVDNSSKNQILSYSRQSLNILQSVNAPSKRQNPPLPAKTFNTNQNNYYYSDSIKQTPRIAQRSSDRFQKDEKFNNNRRHSYDKISETYSQKDQQLQNKLKNYEKRIQNYHKQMSASKLLDSKRSKSDNKTQKNLSDQSLMNFNDDKSLSNNASAISQRNFDKMFSQVRKQRNFKQYQQKSPKQNTSRQRKQFQTSNQKFSYKGKQNQLSLKKSLYDPETSKRQKSPRPSHRFGQQDHQKFIENLKRQREQVSALSKRKNYEKNSVSVDYSRLSPLQRSNQRSQSQNSKLSSVTIVKGKNVDAEIEKLQKKMQNFERMKKQLHLESQKNTQRSASKIKENLSPKVSKQSPMSLSKKYEFKQKSPIKQKSVRFDDQINSQSKRESKRENNDFSFMSRMNSTQRRNQLLKIIAEQNCYVKVRKSIVKQHKTTELKNYLNQELEKESSRSQSTRNQRKQNSTRKEKVSETKQNLNPSGSKNIQSQNYSKTMGQKKVILGLAQNLNNYQDKQQKSKTHIIQSEETQNDVNTPKLLRNLKNKINEKSIVKKKAQKRGFRSQFINDLHQDNELIYSAKKNVDEFQDLISQTSRLRPECKDILSFILSKLQQQITRDQKFRNEKKLFNALTGKDKWTELISEYVKMTGDRKVTLTQIMDIFKLNEEESNPFYSTRGHEFTLQSLISCYIECEQNWNSLLSKVASFSFELLQQCGLNSRNLDIQKKNHIDIQDFTRFLNMEMNKYYRKRDLYLLWKRIEVKSKQNKNYYQFKGGQNFTIEQFLAGLGAQKTNS